MDSAHLPADSVASHSDVITSESLPVDHAAATSSIAVSATRSMLAPDASTLLNDASFPVPTITGAQVSSLQIALLLISHDSPESRF